MKSIKELTQSIRENPRSLSATHAFEQVIWDALERLQHPDETRLREAAEATSALAQQWIGKVDDETKSGTEWYAGQLECLASLLRAALLREVPLAAQAMLKHKHVPALLEALEGGDKTLSDLAVTVEIDLSQAQREVSRLGEHDLVRTVKGGRDRWVRLTSLGYRALARFRQTNPRLSQPMQAAETARSEEQAVTDGEATAAAASPARWATVVAEVEATEALIAVVSVLQSAAQTISASVPDRAEARSASRSGVRAVEPELVAYGIIGATPFSLLEAKMKLNAAKKRMKRLGGPSSQTIAVAGSDLEKDKP